MSFRPTGLTAWWVQRASAVYMLLFLVFLGASLWLYPRPTHGQWRAWFGDPVMSLAVLGFFAALLGHLWVGLRDVLLDYARPERLRHALLISLALSLLLLGGWVLWILLRAHA